MTDFSVIGKTNCININDIPDAVKIIKIRGRNSKVIAHYGAIREDLEFALKSLTSINEVNDETIKEALWRISVIYFIKCFRSGSARGSIRTTTIDEKKVYKGNPEAIVAFRYFSDLRNKHLIHDQNALSTQIPCAAINGGGKPYKIEQVLSITLDGATLERANYSNLFILIGNALDWLKSAFEDKCKIITDELEKESLSDLLARDEPTYRAMELSDMALPKSE